MPFRRAALASCLIALSAVLAASPPAHAQAPKPKPAALPEPTTITADTIEGVSDIEVSARGNAEIRRGDTVIFGDSLKFNRELGRVEGEGGVRLQDGVDRFYGPRLQFNTLDGTGFFEQPNFLLQ